MSVLVCAENIARSSYFKVTQGNFEAGTELCKIPYCGKAFLRNIGDCLSSCKGKIRKSVAARPADPAPKLIELGKPKPVGVFDNQRVAGRNINSAFNNRCANKNIRFPVDKPPPDFGKLLLAHFSVGEGNSCLG